MFVRYTKMAALAVALFFVSFVTGCASETQMTTDVPVVATSSASVSERMIEVQTVDLNGTWQFSEGSFGMIADVENDQIEVQLNSGGSSGLYWRGSFNNQALPGDEIESLGDSEALSASLFGSLDEKKTFAVTEDSIEFPFTMMGVTKTVVLKK